jgi:hypothetical protein
MAKKTANPGEPKPRRAGTNRRRPDRPAEELAPRATSTEMETANDPLAPSEPGASMLDPLPAAGTGPRPSREDVARRAYEIYCGRGHADGHDVEDWLQAERELRAERTGVGSRRNVH